MGVSFKTSAEKTVSQEIREAFKGAVDLILPYRCQICGNVSDTGNRFESYNRLYKEVFGSEADLHICGKCLSSLIIQDEDKRWMLCLSDPIERDPVPGLPLYMPFPYKGLVEQAVPKIKFGRQIEIARFFGCILGSCLIKEGVRADLVVPVPLSSQRLKERGFNQAGEIAYPVARLIGIPYAEDCLIRTKDTLRQSELKDKTVRSANVDGAFIVSDNWDVTGLKVIVTDDVATTGSTLHEAAKTLRKAGASKVLCVAFAGNRQVKNAEPF